MKEYELLSVDKKYQYIVLATSYVNPIDVLYEIEEDLENKAYRGLVIFDLLLCNGLAKNRYIEVYFNGENFEISRYSNIPDIDIEVKKMIYSFYLHNPNMIENSNLPKAQQYLLQKGIIM